MIKLNYFNCIQNKSLKSGIKKNQLLVLKNERNIKKAVLNKTHSMMDWLNLPYTNKEVVEEIQLFGKKISRLFDNFVVLGIGGSALGAKALKTALYKRPAVDEKKAKVFICDYIDPEKFERLLSKLDVKKTMFNIVSKSGATIETLSQFSIIFEKLKKELKEDFFVNLVITTEKNNALWEFAQKNKIKTYEVPKEVGGRFSILSTVGLFPAAVMGIDLKKLLEGAKKVLEQFKNASFKESPAFLSAFINFNFMLKNKNQIVLLPYSKKLNKMADFYIQLIAESLGKKVLINGKKNKLFIMPVKAEGVSSQHSILQLFQEGPDDKIYCFIVQKKFEKNFKTPKFKFNDLDKNLPTNLSELLSAEQKATALALKKEGKPSYEIIVPTINEENIGALLFYFQLTTAIMAEFLQINGYNQPGVEQEKIFNKALLGIRGFEKIEQELKEMLKEEQKYEI